MSRIGNKTITIPAGVEVNVNSNEVTVKGPKGTLTRQFSPLITIKVEDGAVNCTRANEEKHTKQLHGTTRALINNMIIGVSEGFKKELEIIGIGYKAAAQGNKLTLNFNFYSAKIDEMSIIFNTSSQGIFKNDGLNEKVLNEQRQENEEVTNVIK